MATIIHAAKMPPTEHTSNETGRLLIYSIHKRGAIYLLVKDAVIHKGIIMRDPKFLYGTFDFEGLHKEMIHRGFVPMLPAPEDLKSLICTYL